MIYSIYTDKSIFGFLFVLLLFASFLIVWGIQHWRDYSQVNPELIISTDGIDVNGRGLLPWDEVSKIEIVDRKSGKSRRKYCHIFFSNPAMSSFKNHREFIKQSWFDWWFNISEIQPEYLSIQYTRLATDASQLAQIFKEVCPSSVEIVENF